ncbi:hypothetical protein GQ55_2G253900 [Panicum hallii var. hallii]|uniref:Secreted protein n=1 Tax=Panicum hallii var. hallii TaxID=1504633 RepID=A0A2T7ES91_9POAL|nr:hypothetical protein GQ55_2G253900 [Panicum hallii var. hallii]
MRIILPRMPALLPFAALVDAAALAATVVAFFQRSGQEGECLSPSRAPDSPARLPHLSTKAAALIVCLWPHLQQPHVAYLHGFSEDLWLLSGAGPDDFVPKFFV